MGKATSHTFLINSTHDAMHDLQLNHRGFLGRIHLLRVQKKSGNQRKAKGNKTRKQNCV